MMKKLILLAFAMSSFALADVMVFDLTAGFGQGVLHGTGNDFRQAGILGPHADSLTVNGGAPTLFGSAPDNSNDGFRITFDTRGISSFVPGATNTWTFNGLAGTSFSVFGRFAAAGVNTSTLLFSGTVGAPAVVLTQIGGGSNVITASTMAVNLSNVTSAGLAFLGYFTPGNYRINNATLSGLSFIPNAPITTGSFTSTAGNFQGGTLSFTAAAPEPATYMSMGLACVAFGLLRLRRK